MSAQFQPLAKGGRIRYEEQRFFLIEFSGWFNPNDI
jgi:hypothetical protein